MKQYKIQLRKSYNTLYVIHVRRHLQTAVSVGKCQMCDAIVEKKDAGFHMMCLAFGNFIFSRGISDQRDESLVMSPVIGLSRLALL